MSLPTPEALGKLQPTVGVFPAPINSKNPGRVPASTDVNYPIGQEWIYSGTVYVLTAKSAGVATWQEQQGAIPVPLTVPLGGTGLTTITDHGVMVGSGAGAVTPLAVGATGEVLIGATGADPAFGALGVNSGLTDHGVLVGSGNAAITALAVGATGTVLAGTTGADPAFTADPTVTSLTATTINGTTITTNVAAAALSATATTLGVAGTDANISLNLASKGTGSVVYARSAAGVDLNMQITNSDNTAATSNAGLQIAVGGSTNTGDPYLLFQISGVAASDMSMGLDNSASDLFVISNSTALGTNNALTLSQAGALNATTSITAGTTLTATLGAITATNGDLTLATAGNKINIATGANASVGSATLVGGTVTVNTTAVTASSVILLTRQSIGATGAAALGQLTVGTVVAGTSFVINAVQAADATALQASDVSVIGYQIIN